MVNAKPFAIRIPYPATRWMKQVAHAPLLLWRLGLSFLFGDLIMILTTTGRKSGLPRHTAIEFHAVKGRKYVYSGWGDKAAWYKNLLVDPHATLQTAHGIEHVMARPVHDPQELADVFAFYNQNPLFRAFLRVIGLPSERDMILAHHDQLYLMTFDPTNEPTPPPLAADLIWVWGAVLTSFLAGWFLGAFRAGSVSDRDPGR